MPKTHESRISPTAFAQLALPVQEALLAAAASIDASGLEKDLTELMKLRASQINGCAFCIQLHLNIARKLGVPAAKLDLVAVWHEVTIFTPREQAALAWTEIVTRLGPHGVSDTDYAAARAAFDERELANLTATIAIINAWNRIAIPLCYPPPIPKA